MIKPPEFVPPVTFSSKIKRATVFILHGLFGNSNNWASISSRLSTVTQFPFVPVNLPLHARHRIKNQVYTDWKRFCLDTFVPIAPNPGKENRVSLLGHSFGGQVAMQMLRLFPKECFDRVVIVDILPKAYDPHPILDLLHPTDKQVTKEVLSSNGYGKDVIDFILSGNYGADGRLLIQPDVIKATLQAFNVGWDGIDWESILCNTWYIGGEKSPYHDRKMIDRLWPGRALVIPGAGHWVHWEQPTLFAQAIHNIFPD